MGVWAECLVFLSRCLHPRPNLGRGEGERTEVLGPWRVTRREKKEKKGKWGEGFYIASLQRRPSEEKEGGKPRAREGDAREKKKKRRRVPRGSSAAVHNTTALSSKLI